MDLRHRGTKPALSPSGGKPEGASTGVPVVPANSQVNAGHPLGSAKTVTTWVLATLELASSRTGSISCDSHTGNLAALVHVWMPEACVSPRDLYTQRDIFDSAEFPLSEVTQEPDSHSWGLGHISSSEDTTQRLSSLPGSAAC